MTANSLDRFADLTRLEHRFTDDVHGEILLNTLERDCLDSPEYRRLFRISQLGFVRFVYQTANHTRGAHSIGVCAMAQRLIDRLNLNNPQIARERRMLQKSSAHAEARFLLPVISQAETVLIRLGALLHDLSHGPYSHDIEQKSHVIKELRPDGSGLHPTIKTKSHYGLYPKHDDWQNHPALYVLLMDTDRSVLARVIKWYSPKFWELFELEATQPEFSHLVPFRDAVKAAGWSSVGEEVLPQLLFHLLVFEKPDDEEDSSGTIRITRSFDDLAQGASVAWGLGPEGKLEARKPLHDAWYQPYRHDIIGNTLSADLLDYLTRDPQRLRFNRGLHLNLLNYYALAPWHPHTVGVVTSAQPGSNPHAVRNWYRCSIDIYDYKRGTVRMELFNDIFRLLDLRHEIHEKAVFHRVVQAANAMLSRTILLLGSRRPELKDLFGFGSQAGALCGEDHFLDTLVERSGAHSTDTGASNASKFDVRTIALKLAERRVYRPLMVVPGDRVVRKLLKLEPHKNVDREIALRKFAAIVDSAYFAPFFLFVSSAVETLLEHFFASEDELADYMQTLAGEPAKVQEAMKIIPKSVVIWTSPYKQLYKNPGLLVSASADAKAFQVDELFTVEHTGLEEVKDRVEEAVDDAEGKYASLWKLYVFLSDGLFCTGVHAKLQNHECSSDPDTNPSGHPHKRHLEAAQRILITAFQVAFDWFKDHKAEVNLGTPMPPEDFVRLLTVFPERHRKNSEDRRQFHEGISAVKVEQFIHGDDTRRCRDSRYKYDAVGTDEWVASDPSRQNVLDMLAGLGRSVSSFRKEELNQLSTKYREAFGERKWTEGMEVKALWRSPLPQLDETDIPDLTVAEFEQRLATYINNRIENEDRAHVWGHVQARIGDINQQGPKKIARVRNALMELELELEPNEKFAFNRSDVEEMNHWLDDEVFGA
jgi:hypothetical protein